MRYQLAILDDEPISIFTALLDKKLQFTGCVLLHTAAQRKQAQKVVQEYVSFSIKIELIEFEPGCGGEALSLFIQSLYDDFQNRKATLWLNGSCGDRLSVLTAAAIAQSYQQRVFVVDGQQDILSWLYPTELASIDLTDRIKLKRFLSLYGISLKQSNPLQSVPQAWRDLGAAWCASVENNLSALARLNWLAQTADKTNISERLNRSLLNDHQLLGLIDDLEALNLLTWRNNEQLVFADEDARFFANGGWLELHVLGLVKGLTTSVSTIQDYAHSMVVERTVKGQKLLNEIDVAVLNNNRLHAIECKTKRFEGHDADTAIFKLDALSGVLGGVEAKGLLVSFHKIHPRQVARAAEVGINIISGKEVGQLKSRLRSWLEG